jgi:adhesin/invasin
VKVGLVVAALLVASGVEGCGGGGGSGGFFGVSVDVGLSTVTASPTTGLAADGKSAATVTVTILDTLGGVVIGAPVTLAATPSSGVTITAGAATTDAQGEIVFTVTSTTSGSIIFTATVGTAATAVPIVQTATVTFLAIASTGPAGTGITVSPSSPVVADGATAETLTVEARDATGAVIPGATATFTAPAGVTLGSATATTDSNGDASTTIVSTRSGPQLIGITVQDGTGAPVTSTSFTVTFANGAAAGLVFLTQPSQTTAGDAAGPFVSPPPQVAIVDAFGNVVNGTGGGPSDSRPVWLQVESGSKRSNLLNGFSTVLCQGGVATFNYVSQPRVGAYSLVARATIRNASLATASAAFDIVPAAVAPAPGGLMFVNALPNTDVNVVNGIPNASQMSGWLPNTISGTAVVGSIALVDRFGNVVPAAGTSIVIAGVAAAPAPTGVATFNNGNGAVTVTTAANGVASFSIPIADTVLPDTLGFAATQGPAGAGQRSATSTPFQVCASAVTGATLSADGPSNPNPIVAGSAVTSIQATENDSAGNPIIGDNVTVAIVAGTAPVQTITGTAVTGAITAGTTTVATGAGGVADFNNLVFDVSGTYTLQFTSATANVSTATLAVKVIGGAPATLQFLDVGVASPNAVGENAPDTGEPRNAAPGASLGNVQVAVLDANGNIATVATATPAQVVLTGSPANVTLNGTTTNISAGGIITFSNLTVSGTGATVSSPYTLTAVSGAAAPLTAQSAPFAITNPLSVAGTPNTSAAASRIVFTEQPPLLDVADTTFVDLQVEALDSSAIGAVVTGDAADIVSISVVSPATPTAPTGIRSATMVAGRATFPLGFIVESSDAATGYYFIARSLTGTNQAAVSNLFDSIPFPTATALSVVASPQQTASGTVIGSTGQFQAGVAPPATGVSPGPVFQVAVLETDGFLISDFSQPMSVLVTGGNAILSGTTTVNVVDGIATFSGLTLTGTALPQTVTLTFVVNGVTPVNATITVTN